MWWNSSQPFLQFLELFVAYKWFQILLLAQLRFYNEHNVYLSFPLGGKSA